MMLSGVMSLISTILSFAMLSVLLSSRKCCSASVLLLKKVSARCYLEHEHGFYVYAKPNRCDPKTVTKYIGRYLGRPVIATSRIDSYTGDLVSFHYNRHEDDQYVQETIPVMDFIKRLIRRIPEKHFKMIRYGGLLCQTSFH